MAYRIKYQYITGNSFGSSSESGVIDMSWEKLNAAKENLKRIKEHYDLYTAAHRSYCNKKQEAEKVRALKIGPDKPWYYSYNGDMDSYYFPCALKLLTDDWKEWILSAPWCGYFESLQSAEIVGDDDEMRIEYD